MSTTLETRVRLPALKRSVEPERLRLLFAHESEDAHLTGLTRSLFRRLLALNIRELSPKKMKVRNKCD